MKVLLICKEMIGYERTAIMVLGSRLKESGHEVKAAVLRRPQTKQENHHSISRQKCQMQTSNME